MNYDAARPIEPVFIPDIAAANHVPHPYPRGDVPMSTIEMLLRLGAGIGFGHRHRVRTTVWATAVPVASTAAAPRDRYWCQAQHR